MHDATNPTFLWKLLGIHSASINMGSREKGVDESLGLNCVWSRREGGGCSAALGEWIP